eukprot:5297533-Prymnesium_polylepis.1
MLPLPVSMLPLPVRRLHAWLIQPEATLTLGAARSLADRTSQITALRGADRRSSPTCPTLSSGSPA